MSTATPQRPAHSDLDELARRVGLGGPHRPSPRGNRGAGSWVAFVLVTLVALAVSDLTSGHSVLRSAGRSVADRFQSATITEDGVSVPRHPSPKLRGAMDQIERQYSRAAMASEIASLRRVLPAGAQVRYLDLYPAPETPDMTVTLHGRAFYFSDGSAVRNPQKMTRGLAAMLPIDLQTLDPSAPSRMLLAAEQRTTDVGEAPWSWVQLGTDAEDPPKLAWSASRFNNVKLGWAADLAGRNVYSYPTG